MPRFGRPQPTTKMSHLGAVVPPDMRRAWERGSRRVEGKGPYADADPAKAAMKRAENVMV